MSIVLLEHLPSSFTEATLASIITHVQCKGRIVSTNLVPDGDALSAHVHFERHEDADAAVRLWDQLTIDQATISASSEQDTKRRLSRNVTAQHNSGLRYPFAPMNIGWLYEFVNSHKPPQKGFVMCNILECLMCNAVTTSDPFMEHAVVHFYTKFSCSAWSRAQGQMPDGVSFELCRQVFEVIGLIRRYPSANAKSRKMLLTLVERVVDDISKVTITSKAEAVNKAIPEVIVNVRSSIAALRAIKTEGAVPDSEQANLGQLMSWLKFLFSCLSSHQSQAQPPEAPGITPCSEHCACFAELKVRFPVLVADVEKAKVIDALVVLAGRDATDSVAGIARDLLQHYNIDFCARAVAHVHNGKFAVLRIYVFDALRFAKQIQKQTGVPPQPKILDLVEIALLTAGETCRDHPPLNAVISWAAEGLKTLNAVRIACDKRQAGVPGTVAPNDESQLYYTLYYTLQQMFTALCAPTLILCVHEVTGEPKDSAAAAGENGGEVSPPSMVELAAQSAATRDRCGNPECSTPQGTDLLKCSRCKQVYYCSVPCQKADWKRHKARCKEPMVAVAAKPAADVQAIRDPIPAAPIPGFGSLTPQMPLPPPLPMSVAAAAQEGVSLTVRRIVKHN